MLRIAHASDLHGDLGPMLDLVAKGGQPDVWLLTGDMFPNETRGFAEFEVPFQEEWAHDFRAELAELFAGQTVITVAGNHDYADLATILRSHGAEVHEVNPEGVMVKGLCWAGFREVPYMAGEWAGETQDFTGLVDRVVEANPDILVTHAPAGGVLDSNPHRKSIHALATAVAYRLRNVRAHFFGHVHEWGGQEVTEMGIRFFNGAEHCRMIEL